MCPYLTGIGSIYTYAYSGQLIGVRGGLNAAGTSYAVYIGGVTSDYNTVFSTPKVISTGSFTLNIKEQRMVKTPDGKIYLGLICTEISSHEISYHGEIQGNWKPFICPLSDVTLI